MTPDQLRTGAALVRALLDGDDTARGPLSDWILEHGLPLGAPYDQQHAARLLRAGGGTVTTHVGSRGGVRAGYSTPREWTWLGTWPAWAWNGDSPC